ncbi:trub family pseudouridylate synthase-containing protein [Tirmania nivea]|nr:trub family pseudouridylate synthase-containing protein [Tirmania nivea]
MATSYSTSGPIVEGLFAVNKPTSISSAEVLRKLQIVFKKSPLFKDWLSAELAKRRKETNNQKRRRSHAKKGRIQVKLGHGGTLDPMATGVLVVGVGSGTKKLPTLLGGEKEYVATAILGAATDTYDRLGKVTKRAEWRHVTREMVEEKLKLFRGDIMQVPPIFSALNMNGKRLYEYARNGEELPKEIDARKMKVDSLELLSIETEHSWGLPGPGEEADESFQNFAKKFEKKVEELEGLKEPEAKRVKVNGDGAGKTTPKAKRTPAVVGASTVAEEIPPILRLHMTVSSGFYVRSFIHDLGIALGSAAHMVALMRTRQSAFELGKENTIEWEDFGIKLKGYEFLKDEENGKGKDVEGVDGEEEEEEGEEEGEGEGEEKPRPVWERKFTRAMELFGQSERAKGG